jgi:hypothetical protein
MNIRGMMFYTSICFLFVLCVPAAPVSAGTDSGMLENAVSATLDLWRLNWTEQLYERLAQRGTTSKDQFVEKMRGIPVRPACCWQKMDNFKLLNENGIEATVSAKIGLEIAVSAPHETGPIYAETIYFGTGTVTSLEYITREFKLINDAGVWKMQMNDIFSLRNYH